jgi:hypothetical protein
LQYFIKEYLAGPVLTKEDIDEAEPFLTGVFGRKDVLIEESSITFLKSMADFYLFG